MIKDIFADPDELVAAPKTVVAARVETAAEASERTAIARWVITLAAFALVLRIGYLLVGTTDPRFVAWYLDSFHHWQISYLSKEIGFFNGPRLWDLGGLEYFWGFIPAVLGALALAVTFNSAIWPMQLLNVAAGSATVGVLYLVGRRYWGRSAGLALALFFAVSPVSILTDASAMQEPIALLFLALALYHFVDRPVRAGLFLGLAAASRPDYWAYSLAILGTAALVTRAVRLEAPFIDLRRIAPYLGGYAIPLIPYGLHLWLQTGNPVYPLYWNFLGNARGEWLGDVPFTDSMRNAQAIARGLLAVGLVGQLLVIWRRPTGWPVLVAGLWGLILIGYMLGISQYIRNYLDRFWLDRIMLLMYLFAGAIVAMTAGGIERLVRVRRIPVGAIIVLPAIVSLVLLWPLAQRFQSEQGYLRDHEAFGEKVAAMATDGAIVVPGDQPVVTFALVERGVAAERLVSALYHPDYPAQREELFAWLRRFDVRWMLVKPDDRFYTELVAREPAHFERVSGGVLQVYRVIP